MEAQERPLLLLTVDDDRVDRLAIRRALKQAGFSFELHEAVDARQALDAARQHPFSCIFLDYQLPGKSGLDLLVDLRAAGITAPVIMLTGQGDDRVAAELIKAGATDYLTKAVLSAESLARSLRTALKVHKAEQQAAQAEAALHQYTAELTAQNQELDAFAHTVAHDLKTPLSLVSGFAELAVAQFDQLSKEELRDYLLRIIHGGRQMDRIIRELLLLASIQKDAIDVTPVDMSSALRVAFYRLENMIRDYQPTIIIPEEWPAALGYDPWIEEVWTNYLSNGLKYGGQPPRLELGATEHGQGQVRFWIQDNGQGIIQEDQAKLFLPFTRLDRARAEGQGLGLSIIQRIIHKLGGQVGVKSRPGEGSTFWFTLPKAI